MKTRTGCLVKRGKTFYVQWKIEGKTFRETTGKTNRRDAETERARIMAPYALGSEVTALESVKGRLEGRKSELERLENERNPPPQIGSIVNKNLSSPVWLAFMASSSRPDSGESTLRQYESEWKRFVAWISKTYPDVVYLHQVTRQHAEAYAADLNADKVSASTFNQHRNLLRLLWRVLADAARTTGNPWDSITPRKLNALATRKRAVTPGQFDSLLLATEGDTDLRDLFLVLAWTGQRLVDGVTLKWGEVDFARGIITLAPKKTARRQGKQVHIPLFPAVREVLDRREAGHPVNPAGYVFPEIVESYERDDGSTLAKRIAAAFKKAGMDTTEERENRSRAVTVYGAHSLRHFFVTAAASAGMPAAMVKSITGHASDSMQEHYIQIGADMAVEIAARMTASGGVLSLPEPGATEGKADARPTLQDDLGALLAKVREIADRINLDTWTECRKELLTLASAN